MRDELNRLAGDLRTRLPEHTYKAAIDRIKRRGKSDAERRALLVAAIEGWDNERAKEGVAPLAKVTE